MADSQSSTSSCSDRDSERNIPNFWHKPADTETDGDVSMLPINTMEHDVGKQLHEEQRNNSELKQPKTIKNIMIALKEGKNRENSSPMRSNHTKTSSSSNQRIMVEASPRVSRPGPGFVSNGPKGNAEASGAKPNADSSRRTPSLKHQVLELSSPSLSPSSPCVTSTWVQLVHN